MGSSKRKRIIRHVPQHRRDFGIAINLNERQRAAEQIPPR
jgi:hypothetical protein